MNDDELLARVRHDLDDFAGPPSTPPALPLARPFAVPPARRPWLLVSAAAATVAILVTGLVLLTRDESAELEVSPSASTTDAPQAADELPVPPTPDGWVVVEWGDVRLSLPPDLDPFGDACTTASERELVLTITCGSEQVQVLSGITGTTLGDETDVVNGLTTERGSVPDEPTWSRVSFAETVSAVWFAGVADQRIDAIAATAGVSSTWRAVNEAAPPVPDDWAPVEFEGVALRVPSDWLISNVDPTAPDPDRCQVIRAVSPGVAFGRGTFDPATDCGRLLASPTDGVRIYVDDGTSTDDVPGEPLTHRVITRSDGQRLVVRVGFGIDGTVGRAILSTIRPATPTAATTAPPPSADLGLPVPPTPEGWQVVEWGDVRLSLPPELNPSGIDEGGASSCVVQNVQGIFALTCGEQKVTIIPAVGAAGPDGADALDLNGVTARRTENRCPSECVPDFRDSTEFVLVDLGVLVRFTGFDEPEIDVLAGTLGVSSRWRARREAPPPVPADWATFDGGGFTFRHPADWPETELGASDRDPDFCRIAPAVFPAVTIGVGDVGASVDCDVTLAPPSDGVRVVRRDGAVVVADGATEAVVLTATDGAEWVVRVGFGTDGSTGRAILASITSTLPPPPPTSAPPPDDTVYEAAMTVIQDDGELPQLCVFGVDQSSPPQCPGIDLVGFDWGTVTPEGLDAGTTWGLAYVRGTYDRATDTLTVIEARPPSEADGLRLAAAWDTRRDRSVPCPTPADGWPPAPAAWPGARLYDVGVFDWYLDDAGSVLIVKTNGDVAERESAVRTVFDGPLCVVAVQGDRSDLEAIVGELAALSSVQFSLIDVVVDPNDAWVMARIVAPDPDLQSHLDAEYGDGIVRLASTLVPAAAPT